MQWARTLCGGSKVASLGSVPLVENCPNDNRHRYGEYSACYETGVPPRTGVGCSRIVHTDLQKDSAFVEYREQIPENSSFRV